MSSSVFRMRLDREPNRAEPAVEAMRQMSSTAREHSISELSLEEINEEIAAARESGAKRQ